MVKLDAAAIHFIRLVELQTDRWIRFESVVQKQHLLAAQPPREKGIPHPPNGFADGWHGEKAFEQGHTSDLADSLATTIGFILAQGFPLHDEAAQGRFVSGCREKRRVAMLWQS